MTIDHTKIALAHALFENNPVVRTFHWQTPNPSQETIDQMKVACTVDAISFEDGTTWKAAH